MISTLKRWVAVLLGRGKNKEEDAKDACPLGCEHKTFHYCIRSGLHCNKHCACDCVACVHNRICPAPLDEYGVVVLKGESILV